MQLSRIKKRHLRLGKLILTSRQSYSAMLASNGNAQLPVNIHLQPTLACNLSCRMCIQNGPAGYLREDNSIAKARLDLSVWENFLSQAASHGPFVHVWGGEPLLYRDIDDLVAMLRGMDLPVMMTTNAVRGMNHLDAIMKLDVLRISIDGPEQVHDSVRGRPGTFQAILDLVSAVANEKKKRKSFFPRIVTNTLIIDDTYKHLRETVSILSELPLDRCDLSLPMFTTAQRGKAYARILEKEFGTDARAWKGFMIEGLAIDINEVIETINNIRKKYSRTKFNLFPIGHIDGINDWYQNLDETFGFKRCHAILSNLNVLPNGEVVLCNDLPDVVIGNIKEQDFAEIWNGEKARAFRRRLAKGLLPVCSRCCMFYNFPMYKAAVQQRWLR